jgi:AcrR family transcriptional regulator
MQPAPIFLPPEVSKKRSYHHGDLSDALLAQGLQLLEENGATEMSLREVAREVGVSVTAVYRHFPDKAALLRALAGIGLSRLTQAQMDASHKAGGGAAGFNASGHAYVRFAQTYPSMFRLIMSYTPATDYFVAKKSEVPSPIRFLRESVAALAPEGTQPEAIRLAALCAWSQVHGLAMLLLDRQIAADDALVHAIIDANALWPQATAPRKARKM